MFDDLLKIAPWLALSDVRVDMWEDVGGGAGWISVRCQECPKGIWYRFGARHSRLMGKNGKEWAVMRGGTLLRLLLKKLAREIANGS